MSDPLWTKQRSPQQGTLDIQLSFPEPFVSAPVALESIVKRYDRVEQFDTLKLSEAIFHPACFSSFGDASFIQMLRFD